MSETRIHLILTICLLAVAQFASAQEPQQLQPGQPVERTIAGGESHTFQIDLAAGQYLRVMVDQRGMDVKLSLAGADGKPLIESDLAAFAGVPEFLSIEAPSAGVYRLGIVANGAAYRKGSYAATLELRSAASAEDRSRSATESLLNEARRLQAEKKFKDRKLGDNLEKALASSQELQDRYLQALTLNLQGVTLSGVKQYERAITALDASLALWIAQNMRAGQAATLSKIADANRDLGRIDKAVEFYSNALSIQHDLNDQVGSRTTLRDLAISYIVIDRYDDALKCFEKAFAISRELGDLAGQARAMNDQGGVHEMLKHYEKAIGSFEGALAIALEAKDMAGKSNALTNLAGLNDRIGFFEKALEYGQQSLTVARDSANRNGELEALRSLGGTYSSMARYQESVESYEKALAIARETKSRASEAISLGDLGLVHAKQDSYGKAIEYHSQALTFYRELNYRFEEAVTLGRLARAYQSDGAYEKAIENYQAALEISRRLKDRASEAGQLNDLANLYRSLGRNEKIIAYYEQALALLREDNDRVRVGVALTNLADAHRSMGQIGKALEYHEQSLAIARDTKDRLREGRVLNNIGIAYSEQHDYTKAIEYYDIALAIFRELKDRSGEASALGNIGIAYYQLGDYAKSVNFHVSCLAIRRDFKDSLRVALSLQPLARAKAAQGDLVSARSYIEEGIDILESIRRGTVSPESRVSFVASKQQFYKLYTDILMRLHRRDPDRDFAALAFESSESQRSRGLVDLLSESAVDIRQGVDTTLLERERSIGYRLNNTAERLAAATKPEQKAALTKLIEELESEYERAHVSIRKASPQYAALTQPQSIKLSDIQRQLDSGTVLLEYSMGVAGQDHSYLWAITQDSLTSYELPNVKVIEKSAREVYELLTARSTNKKGETASQRRERISQAEARLPAAALELSKTIIAPVASQLESKRLIIVPDGALQYIPFAMLPDPAAGNNQPLIVGHEVVSLPSASTLVFQRRELAGRQPAPKTLAIIADPVFDRSDVRFKAASPAPEDKTPPVKPADTRGLEHILDESATSEKRVIRRLPFTRQEADALVALTPKNSSFKAIDFQANRTNVLNGDLSQYKYVHFATHGVMDAERPGLSSLVLSTVDAAGKPQNGFLRANDIYNMKLPAELVVLSACQTGLGKEVKGEGLIGLTRGFMYAGAKRVVVSLWSVNDKATSDLMTKFYRGMLKDNQRPAAALRAAQIEMWKQKKWQSPYYWAAFTMQGEWR